MPEPVAGQPLADNAAAAAPDAQAAPQEPKAPQAEPGVGEYPLPEKFAGKSAEEIAYSYMELERKLGEQSQELAALRDMATRPQAPPYPYPGQPPISPYGIQPPVPMPYGYQPPPPGYGMQAPVPPPPEMKMNWDNPIQTFREVIRQEVVPILAGYQQTTAKSMGEIAMQNAKAQNPALFDGVEPNVKAFMTSMIDQGVLRPDSALNPETWRMAAWQMKGLKSNYSFNPPAAAVNPMASVRTEMPGSRPPSFQAPMPPLSEQDRRMSEKMGIPEEQARKLMGGK